MSYLLKRTSKTSTAVASTEKFDNLLDAIVRMKFLQNKTYQNWLNKKPHDSIMKYDLDSILGCAVSDLDTNDLITDEFTINFIDYYNNQYRIELDPDDYIKEQLS